MGLKNSSGGRMKISEDRANEETGLESKRILDKDLFLYLLDLEVKRARRYQNFYCILLLKVTPLANREEGDGVQVCFQILTTLLMDGVRESDILGSLGEYRVVILLPYADASAGGIAKSRLERTLKHYDFESKGCQVLINQICFPNNGTDVSDLVDKVLEINPLSFFLEPKDQ